MHQGLKRYLILAWVLTSIGLSCVKPYTPDVIQAPNQFLVVDGMMHPDTETTVITLSRSRNLADAGVTVPWVSGAEVYLESSGGARYYLPETSAGHYTAMLRAARNESYKLLIRTNDGKEFASGFEPVIETPVIDSIHWRQDQDLSIMIDTHDDTERARYFRWEYKEVWEYRTTYESYHQWNGSAIVYRDLDSLVSRCWDSTSSTEVIVGTTDDFSENAVRGKEIKKILNPDKRLSRFYLIRARQFGLTKGAYTYWDEIRKNGTQIGGIFDPLPSQISTNITCITNPGETVIGYFSAATVSIGERYIANTDLDGWVSTSPEEINACKVLESYDPFNFDFYVRNPRYLIAYQDLSTLEFKLALAECVDCRLAGGTTKKPDYWPR